MLFADPRQPVIMPPVLQRAPPHNTDGNRQAVADIFISYARVDLERARPFAEALQAHGWDVWWDIESLRSGQSFNKAIQEALSQAKCVLVLWSETSAESRWVYAEAYWAWNKYKLASVVLDEGLELPVPFNTTHSENLYGWSGDTEFVEDFATGGSMHDALIRGYMGEGKLKDILNGENKRYRDNYTFGYAMWVFINSWEIRGKRVFEPVVEEWMLGCAKPRQPLDWFSTCFIDGQRFAALTEVQR